MLDEKELKQLTSLLEKIDDPNKGLPQLFDLWYNSVNNF